MTSDFMRNEEGRLAGPRYCLTKTLFIEYYGPIAC
jgi:hypothetical protein